MQNLSEATLKEWGFTPVGKALPKPYINCVLLTPNGRVLGFLDEDQIWRNARNVQENDVLAWQSLFPFPPQS